VEIHFGSGGESSIFGRGGGNVVARMELDLWPWRRWQEGARAPTGVEAALAGGTNGRGGASGDATRRDRQWRSGLRSMAHERK
jgi:hypothetical protein